MPKFVAMEVFTVEADDQESAQHQAETSSNRSDSVVLVADRLGGLMNPVHHQASLEKFGHIAPSDPTETQVTQTSDSE